MTIRPGADGQIATTAMITFTGDKPMPLRTTPSNGSRGSKLSSHGQVAKMWQLFMDSYLDNGPGGKPYPMEQFPAEGRHR